MAAGSETLREALTPVGLALLGVGGALQADPLPRPLSDGPWTWLGAPTDTGDLRPSKAAAGVMLVRTAIGVLSGHRVVAAAAENGAAYPDLFTPLGGELVLGVTTAAAQDGAPVAVMAEGDLSESSWAWAIGPVFCGPDGQLTQSPPPDAAWLRQVGVAVVPDRLLVQLRPPIILA